MADLGNYQFKVGVGFGGSSNIRVRRDPEELFPDGMVGRFVRRDGRLMVELLNRPSGKKWQRHTTHPNIWQTTISSAENRAAERVEAFASVYPAKAEKIVGGVLLTLPEVLAPPHLRGQYRPKPDGELAEHGTSDAPTPVESEPVQATQTAGSSAPETPEVRGGDPVVDKARGVTHIISLEDAVRAVNQWKETMSDRLELRIDERTGKLRARAEYGED